MNEISYEPTNYLIECYELKELIEHKRLDNIRILDCSWYIKNIKSIIRFLPTDHRVGRELFKIERIPYSQFFDIDDIADKSTCLPHMFPSNDEFISHMKRLDIRKNDQIICYDRQGVFSSPRVWYLLKLFGIEDVKVLNGGFRKWLEEGCPTESNTEFNFNKQTRSIPKVKDFEYKLDTTKLMSMKDVLNLTKEEQIIDCRCKERYLGISPEPRPTKRVGHVQGAINICFIEMLNEKWCLKSREEISNVFNQVGVDINKRMNFYCGSGLTACILIFAASQLGKFCNCSLYDGSWAEYVRSLL